jgi:hypothetical protein
LYFSKVCTISERAVTADDGEISRCGKRPTRLPERCN